MTGRKPIIQKQFLFGTSSPVKVRLFNPPFIGFTSIFNLD